MQDVSEADTSHTRSGGRQGGWGHQGPADSPQPAASLATYSTSTGTSPTEPAVPGVLVENVATTGKTLPDFTGRWAAMLAGTEYEGVFEE